MLACFLVLQALKRFLSARIRYYWTPGYAFCPYGLDIILWRSIPVICQGRCPHKGYEYLRLEEFTKARWGGIDTVL